MNNLEIANFLSAIASCYQIKGEKENRFRIIAYQRAADAVEHLSSEAKDLWDDGKLKGVSGIGESIEKHLDEIFTTGKSSHFKKLAKGIPAATFELIKVPGIGVKTAYTLASEFKIEERKALEQLKRIAEKGEIAKLANFGVDSQRAILAGIEEVEGREERLLLPYAVQIADEISSWLKKSRSVERVDALGSLRRKASTVGDVDVAVSSNKPAEVIDHFCKYPKKARVLERGERTATIILPGNRQVDLMVEEPNAYGALLQHFTGSKHHNIALRKIGIKKDLSISDYGVRQKIKGKKSKLKKFKDEESLYKYLGMDWIPPELREDTGEIEASLTKRLPKLVELADVKADLQVHSDFNIETSHDLGESTMEECINKAQDLGYEYLAFTEHNPSRSKHNEKQITDLIKRKKEKIDEINSSLLRQGYEGLKKVFNSLEIDIRPNGKLPVTEAGLELLDFALVSVHSSFRQNREKMTDRVIKALSHPKVKIFAHPTARKLNVREGIELNWNKIFEYCKDNKKWLEINADPMRLDLPDSLVKDAISEGVMLTLGTDAHNVDGMDNMVWGVSVAKRGWVEKEDIVNTRNLKEFVKMLR